MYAQALSRGLGDEGAPKVREPYGRSMALAVSRATYSACAQLYVQMLRATLP